MKYISRCLGARSKNGSLGRKAKLLSKFKKLSPSDFEKTLKIRESFIYSVSEKWQKIGLSALISPVFPHCSFKNEESAEMNQLREYGHIWSIVGYPCGVFPVTRVRNDEVQFTDHFRDRWTHLLNNSAQSSVGMPVGVGIIGYTGEDEIVLGIMKQLEAQLGYRAEVPNIIPDGLGGLMVQKGPQR